MLASWIGREKCAVRNDVPRRRDKKATARAQHAAIPVIGLLHGQSPEANTKYVAAFRRGLIETGFTEGTNVSIDYHWSEGHVDRVIALANEMARNRYAAIVVLGSTPGALALKAATQTIPIIFQIGPDPVAAGLVASLNHPGGNLTGASIINVEVIAKRLELLLELVPAAKSVAHLVNVTNAAATEAETNEMRAAASALGLRLVTLSASTPNEIEAAFAILLAEHASALVGGGDSFFRAHRDQIVALAARYRVPAVYGSPPFAASGGLMSYGSDPGEAYRIVGAYAGRILRGEKPANLPVQQPTKFELVINLETAKALGLTIPETLLATADEVIQ
jgi:putative tryptophan/tyrosine transport system substrate-binding protein